MQTTGNKINFVQRATSTMDEVNDLDGPSTLSAGTFEKILDWVVFESTETSHIRAFCVTYQKFMGPQPMIDLLLENYETKRKDCPSEKAKNAMLEKLDNFFFCLLENNSKEEDTLIQGLIQNNFKTFQCLEKKKRLQSVNGRPDDIETTLLVSKANGFATSTKFFEYSKMLSNYMSEGILNFSVEDIGQGLTLMEQFLLSRIEPKEYLTHEDPKKSPRIAAFACHFNNTVMWLVSEIMAAPDPTSQLQLIKKIISLGSYLLSIHNFNGAMEVICALYKNTVSKLKKTWSHVPASFIEDLNILEKTLSPSRNFHAYRELLTKHAPHHPVVPYLVNHLKDLTFGKEANSFTSTHGLINFEQVLTIGGMITELTGYQRLKYTFSVNAFILRFLCDTWRMDDRDCRLCLLFHEPDTPIRSNTTTDLEDEGWNIDPERLLEATKARGVLSIENLAILYEVATKASEKKRGAHIKNRVFLGYMFYDSFSGFDLATLLVREGVCENRKASREVCEKMLREGFISQLNKTSISSEFMVRHDFFYSFVTQEVPGHDKSSFTEASLIEDVKEREERFFYLAMANSRNGGVKLKHYWHKMECYQCCTGNAIYTWCSTSLHMKEENSVSFLQRLFEQKMIIPVTDIDRVANSSIDFYSFSMERKYRIIRLGPLATSTVSPRLLNRTQHAMDSKSKSKRRSELKASKVEQNLSGMEIDVITKMLHPVTGVPIEGVFAQKGEKVSLFKGSSIMTWLEKHKGSEEGFELAQSLFSRKVLTGYNHKTPVAKNGLSYKLGKAYNSYFTEGGELKKEESCGPVLFERVRDKPMAKGDGNWKTYEDVLLLSKMCHPVKGLKRSNVAISGQTISLFSGDRFVEWLEKEKNIQYQETILVFNNFVQRGFILPSVLHGDHVTFSKEQMYRFSIELFDSRPTTSTESAESTPTRPEIITTCSGTSPVKLRKRSDCRSSTEGSIPVPRRTLSRSMGNDKPSSKRTRSTTCEMPPTPPPSHPKEEPRQEEGIKLRRAYQKELKAPKSPEEIIPPFRPSLRDPQRRFSFIEKIPSQTLVQSGATTQRRFSGSDLGEAIISNGDQVENIWKQLKEGIPTTKKKIRKRERDCFMGKEAVLWLEQNVEVLNCNTALQVVTKMFDEGMIRAENRKDSKFDLTKIYFCSKNKKKKKEHYSGI